MTESKTLTFILPTDEEALNAISQMMTVSQQPAENQISLRLWLTELLRDAGRLPPESAPVELAEEDEAA